ncbi:hypothetical protein [Nonomuraea glycinis]|uniref:hypothetical protein n=1 Tax=Nonomuraea glycinis TaxID=2047744 RepID=UPI0033BDF3CA
MTIDLDHINRTRRDALAAEARELWAKPDQDDATISISRSKLHALTVLLRGYNHTETYGMEPLGEMVNKVTSELCQELGRQEYLNEAAQRAAATRAPAAGGVQLIPFDADRQSITAYLDAHPEWERADRRDPGRVPSYTRWKLDPTIAVAVADSTWVMIDLPTDDIAHLLAEPDHCAEAVRVINAVALRTNPRDNEDVIARLAAIYQTAEPDSDIARIASGQVEPE